MRLRRTSITGLMLLMTPLCAVASDPDLQALQVRVYPVADLVAQPAEIGQSAMTQMLLLQQLGATADVLNNAAGKESREETAIGRNLDELAELLRTTTVPEQWESGGGQGRIATYRKTLSLVVRQTEQGHAEIADLLQMLRRENSLRVEVSVEYLEKKTQAVCHPPATQGYTMISGVPQYSPYASPIPASPVPAAAAPYVARPQPADGAVIRPVSGSYPAALVTETTPDTPQPASQPAKVAESKTLNTDETLATVLKELTKKHGRTMDEQELEEFRERTAKYVSTQLLQKSTQSNGRSRAAGLLVTSSIISPDRRFVDVTVSMPSEAGMVNGAVRIPDGETATVHLAQTDGDGDALTLLVTARIQLIEEEEELISE